jgi:hypothetical protein
VGNPNGKTIRQIANEIGVSKQAVHQKRKSPILSTALRPFTSTIDGVVYISVDGEKLIKSAFCDNAVKDVDVNERQYVDGSFTLVDTLVDTLKEQLSVKDKQINELNSRLAETTSALVAALETSKAAQALHAGTIQAQLGDGSAPGKREGFFSRIFGSKKTSTNPENIGVD